MNLIFIFPVLLILIFVVSEHQATVLDDCEEDDRTGQRKQDSIAINSVRAPRTNFKQRKFTTVPSKQGAFAVRRARKSFNGGQFQRRIMPYPAKFAQQKANPVFVKSAGNRKLNDYYPLPPPFKPQPPRMQYIPAYEEYGSHEAEYEFPERSFEYVEMEDMGNYPIPCDPNDPMMMPIMNRPRVVVRPPMNRAKIEFPQPKEMDHDSTESNSSNESEMREGIVSTTENPDEDTTEHNMRSNIGPIPRSEDLNLDLANQDTIKQVIDLVTKGLCSVISCVKANNPNLHEALAKVLNSAFKTCKTLKN